MATIRKPSFERWWPALARTGYVAYEGSATTAYNCFAWAVGRTDIFLAPDPPPWPGVVAYWPAGIPRDRSLEAFVECFATFDFALGERDHSGREFERIVLYGKADEPRHAARQLADGRWSSKLGHLEIIEHELNAFEGATAEFADFGPVLAFLERARDE